MQISKEQLEAEEFRFIQDNLWIKQKSNTEFTIYNHQKLKEIDLDDYNESDIEFEISGYYKSLKGLRQRHKKEGNFIIAQCIALNDY